MYFNQQIRKIRNEQNITQNDMANTLNVSRQTISNWENGRNLPDIEMLVLISKKFNISLDNLILGDDKMAKKIIKDGSDIKKLRLSVLSISLLVLGAICAVLFMSIPSYVTDDGVLHEPFFLVPIGLSFLLMGCLIGIFNLVLLLINKNKTDH